jgi:transposase
MEVVHTRCCGLDVHKKSISACIVIREHGKTEKLERQFGSFTWELEDLGDWLAKHQVTHGRWKRPVFTGSPCGTCWRGVLN